MPDDSQGITADDHASGTCVKEVTRGHLDILTDRFFTAEAVLLKKFEVNTGAIAVRQIAVEEAYNEETAICEALPEACNGIDGTREYLEAHLPKDNQHADAISGFVHAWESFVEIADKHERDAKRECIERVAKAIDQVTENDVSDRTDEMIRMAKIEPAIYRRFPEQALAPLKSWALKELIKLVNEVERQSAVTKAELRAIREAACADIWREKGPADVLDLVAARALRDKIKRFKLDEIAHLPPRRWVLGRRLLAGAVTLGYAAPGLGKTLIGGLTAIAVITGRCDLTGETTHLKGPVLIINNEEPIEELQKRIGAACQEYRIDKAEVDGKLFLLSGLGARILVAIKDKDKVGVTAVVAELKRYLKQHSIVHVSFDPLVSLHSGTSEMDNDDMEKVFSILADIANDCGVSVEAIHHTRKGQGRVSSDKGAGREDFRGAQSQGGSARVTYKIVRVHPKHQAWPRIPPELRTGSHRLVALHAQKANYSADTTEVVAVFAIKSVTIANGDDVGVPIIVKLSSPTEALLSQDAKILRVIAETMENMTYGATAKASEFYPAIMAAFDVKRRTAMDYLGEAFAAQNPAITITTAGKHYKLRMTEGGNGSSRKITMDPAEDEDEEI